MSKDLSISLLMDFYGQLLTQKQLDTLDMYYNQDLSLGEISEETSISRQGARDAIKRGEKQLIEFEEKLGLVSRFERISENVSRMNEIIDTLEVSKRDRTRLDEVKRILNDLSDIL